MATRMATALGWKLSLRTRQSFTAYLFLLPTLIFFGVFVIYPILSAFDLSFRDWRALVDEKKFVGLSNYAEMLDDSLFRTSLLNTTKFVAMFVPANILISLGLALLLDRRAALKSFWRTTYFAPVMTSIVAAGLIWTYLYQPTFGLINQVLEWMQLPASPWLTHPRTALVSVIIMAVWQTVGFNMILFLAGLQGIPEMYYEAARVDGAGGWQCFRHITIPLLRRTTLFVFVTTIIWSWQVFTQVYVMTAWGVGGHGWAPGGPVNSTMVLVLYIQQTAFRGAFRFGYASAMAVALFLILLVFTLVQLRMLRSRWEY